MLGAGLFPTRPDVPFKYHRHHHHHHHHHDVLFPQSLRDILREPAAARRGPHHESVEGQAAASRRPGRLRAAGPLRDRLRVPSRPL